MSEYSVETLANMVKQIVDKFGTQLGRVEELKLTWKELPNGTIFPEVHIVLK